MGAGKGGDGGGGEAAAAAPEAAQPVVLKMDLHCAGCAHKVKKAIKRVPGVESIVTDVAANRVVVAGSAEAGALKARLEAKTGKPVEVVSAGGGAPKKPAAAAEPKQDAGAGAGETKEVKGASPKEEEKDKEKKQHAEEEKKPKQETTTVLLKIRLHCDGCADRIRRRVYKIKGVKDVVLEGNAKDELKVTGTMDIPNMVSYLKEKLNRDVEAVAAPPAKTDGGGEGKDDKKDSAGSGDKNKSAAVAGGDEKKDKGKGIDLSAGPSTAAAAAFMAAPAGASTYHVAPPYGYVAYQQQQQQAPPPPASYYSYPYYGNGDGMGMDHANPAYYHQPPQQQQQYDGNQQPPMAYPPYPYRFDMAPPPQLFSDENPNACSVM